jgi:hypothetical protein
VVIKTYIMKILEKRKIIGLLLLTMFLVEKTLLTKIPSFGKWLYYQPTFIVWRNRELLMLNPCIVGFQKTGSRSLNFKKLVMCFWLVLSRKLVRTIWFEKNGTKNRFRTSVLNFKSHFFRTFEYFRKPKFEKPILVQKLVQTVQSCKALVNVKFLFDC